MFMKRSSERSTCKIKQLQHAGFKFPHSLCSIICVWYHCCCFLCYLVCLPSLFFNSSCCSSQEPACRPCTGSSSQASSGTRCHKTDPPSTTVIHGSNVHKSSEPNQVWALHSSEIVPRLETKP